MTLPASIRCSGQLLYPSPTENGVTTYSGRGLQIWHYADTESPAWTGCASDGLALVAQPWVSGDTWQEVVRELERRPWSERAWAAVARAWRWVKEVVS